ncbi:MAG TPA: glycosyltransferase family 39 protein [Candidatus Polarisedimenticolia bacterium]|nr:glycosyltransferase family 39 protein [Candidatus Polarisedimenticolia bacterium]
MRRTAPSPERPILYEAPGALSRHGRAVSWGVFLVALLARAAYVKQLRDTPLWDDLPVDLGYYRDWALRIAAGEWEGTEVFEQSPLYAYILAAVFKLFGPGLLAPRLLQIVIGSATCVLIGRTARRLISPVAGLAAGMAAALYGPFLFYDGMLMKEVFAVFFMAAMLDQLTAGNGSQRGTLALAGLCLGLGSLVRDNLILVGPAAALWLAIDPWVGGLPPGPDPGVTGPRMTRGQVREGAARVAAFGAGLLLAVLPVTARNHHVSGELVLLTAGGGEVFYIGNNDRADGRYSPPPFVRAEATAEHEDFRREAARRLGRPSGSLTRKESSDFWLAEGLRWIRSHPGDFAALVGRKMLIFWNHYELPDNHHYDHHRRLVPLLGMPLLTFGLLAPLAAAGMVLTARRWRDLLCLYLIGGGYLASVMLFFVFGRFRLPLIPVLAVLAAGAAAGGWEAAVRRRKRTAAAAAAAALAAGLIVWADPDTDPVHRGQSRSQLAELLRRAGRLDEAAAESEAGLALMEPYAARAGGTSNASLEAALREARSTHLRILKDRGLHAEAAAWEKRHPPPAAPTAPAAVDEGSLLMARGEFLEAASFYERVLRDMKRDAGPVERVRVALRRAEALHRAGRPRQALAEVEAALDGAPGLPPADMAAAHFGEALIYRDLGEPERMRFHLRECLRLNPAHPRAAWMRELLAEDPLSRR